MNIIFFLISLATIGSCYADYGLIQDPDGHVNVRDQALTKSKIIAQLNNGEVVRIIGDYTENHFNYVLNSQLPDHSGYIHESRINLFKDFQKWQLKQSSALKATYASGKNTVTVIAQQAQIKTQDFRFGQSPSPFQHYKNKPFWGTDGQIPLKSLQLARVDILFNGQKMSISAQDLESYFLPSTPLFQGDLKDFAQAEIYSKDSDLYIMNNLAIGGAAQYTLVLRIQNGKLTKIQAWNAVF